MDGLGVVLKLDLEGREIEGCTRRKRRTEDVDVVIDDGAKFWHFLVGKAVDVGVCHHFVDSVDDCVVLVRVDRVEQGAVRKLIGLVVDVEVVELWTYIVESVVIVFTVHAFVVSDLVEAGEHETADVTAAVTGRNLANAGAVDTVQEVTLLLEQRPAVNAEMLKHRETNEEVFGGEVVIGDEKRLVNQRKGTGVQW